ncbi:MAG: hypothetical protein AAGD43_04730 [Pseudomonadota bacterium]
MGKGSRSKTPEAPDPQITARAEAQFNRPDTYTPSGSGTRNGYTDPVTGQFVSGPVPVGSNAQSAVSTVESDSERAIRMLLEPASVNLTERVISDNVTNMPGPARVQDRGTVAQDIFDRNFSLMKPAIDKANERLLVNLQSRGLPVGGEAFNEAYGEQQRNTEETISRLAQDANISAGQEQTRMFNLDAAERGSAIQEIVALMGGGYQPTTAQPSGSVQPVNYSGLVNNQYQAQVQQANQDSANRTATASTIGTLGAAALLKCSVQYKDVKVAVNTAWAGEAVAKLPVFGWTYKPEHAPDGDSGNLHVGPMAEHFKRVTGLSDGNTIDTVDMMGVMLAALQWCMHRIDALEHHAAAKRLN